MHIKLNKRYLCAFAALILTEVFIALYVHDNFIRPYIGDVLVIVVIYCFIRIFFHPYKYLPMWIFTFAAAVEITQYFDIASLLGVSENPFLSTILGSVFDIKDLLCYFIGCLILTLWQLNKIKKDTNL